MRYSSFPYLSALLIVVLVALCYGLYLISEEFAKLAASPPDPVERSELVGVLYQTLAPCFVTGETSPVSNRLRICSYNIENFSDGVGDGTLRSPDVASRQAKAAAALIAEIDPDVLVLQEIENAAALEVLNRAMDPPFAAGYVTDLGDGGHPVDLNLAVLSRIRLEGVTEIDFGPLEGTNLPPRGVLRFLVPVDSSHRVLVYGLHLKSNYGSSERNIPKRRKAVQVVADDIRRIARDTAWSWEAMVLGDMNVDPDAASFADDPSLQPLAALDDLWRGTDLAARTTVPTRHGDPERTFPPVAFDRILVADELASVPWVAGEPQRVAAGVNTEDADAVPGIDPVHVSDHYPIYIDLTR